MLWHLRSQRVIIIIIIIIIIAPYHRNFKGAVDFTVVFVFDPCAITVFLF